MHHRDGGFLMEISLALTVKPLTRCLSLFPWSWSLRHRHQPQIQCLTSLLTQRSGMRP